jgi:hypothetical protein
MRRWATPRQGRAPTGHRPIVPGQPGPSARAFRAGGTASCLRAPGVTTFRRSRRPVSAAEGAKRCNSSRCPGTTRRFRDRASADERLRRQARGRTTSPGEGGGHEHSTDDTVGDSKTVAVRVSSRPAAMVTRPPSHLLATVAFLIPHTLPRRPCSAAPFKPWHLAAPLSWRQSKVERPDETKLNAAR